MNILYASNDGFARHLGTSMYSLFDKNRGAETITVYVLSLGLSEENIEKLLKKNRKLEKMIEYHIEA